MHSKTINNRIKPITEELKGEDPVLSVIIRNPGESDEVVQQRADQLKTENIRKYGRSVFFVIVTNYAAMEAENVTNS